MNSIRRFIPILSVVLLLLWMAGLLAAYYLYHKPIDITLAGSILRIGWIILTVAWILSLAGGLGKALSPWIVLPPLERAFLQMVLGLGIFSVVVLFLAVIGFYFKYFLWLLFFVPFPFLYRSIRLWWADLRSIPSLWEGTSRFGKILSVLVGFICLQSAGVALASPIHFDALTYHLALPRLYLDSGSILSAKEWLRAGMPQTGEMLYTWAMASGQVSAAPFLGWAVGIMALVALQRFMSRFLQTNAVWVGIAALVSGRGVSAALGWGYIDWFCLVFGVAALISFQASRQEHIKEWLFLTGLFCGWAFATKYTAGVIFAGLSLVLFWEMIQARKWNLIDWAALTAGFALPVLPWMLKNWILAGNPVSPYIWGSALIPAVRQQVIQGSIPFGNWMDVVFLPFRATILGVDGGVGYSHTIGVLLLMLGAVCWIKQPLSSESQTWIRTMAIVSGVTLLLWIAGNRFSGLLIQNRMYYAAFPAFACLAATGFAALSQIQVSGVRFFRISAAVVFLVVGLNVIEGYRELIRSQVPAYLSGVISETDYKQHNLGWYQPAVTTVSASEEKTLLLYEPRGFECLGTCEPDEILDRWSFAYHTSGSCEAVLTEWKTEGFTRVLVNRAGIEFFKTIDDPNHTQADLKALQECLNTLTPIQEFGDAYSLFQLE